MTIRPASAADLPAITRIQAASPEASQWNPSGYLEHFCEVAEEGGNVLGFLVFRQTGPDEHEILNLAVDPHSRRKGVARALINNMLRQHPGTCFLEARASNSAAIALYESVGFSLIGRRKGYYHNPYEEGIVMKFVS